LSTIERDLLLAKGVKTGIGRLAAWENRATLIAELRRAGIKHTPSAIVRIARMPDGQIVFLERGSSVGPRPSGLAHILDHADDFAHRGIPSEQIPDLLLEARTQNKIVGYQGRGTGRPIYEVIVNGHKYYVAITIGSNGYIVGANPATWP
jgi:hypothetical protein